MADSADLFSPPLRIVGKDGQPIENVEAWRTHAAPAGGDRQWVDGRSAKELAKAWVGTGQPKVPDALTELLESAEETTGAELGIARPEARLRLDYFRGNTRNADLLVYGTVPGGRLVLTVEAKADESFAGTLNEELARKRSDRSKVPDRIDALCTALFGWPFRTGEGTDPRLGEVRYQLVHGVAATMFEADHRSADLAIFIVHEFPSDKTDAARLARNWDDLNIFLAETGVTPLGHAGFKELTIPAKPDPPAPRVLVGKISG